MVDITIKVIDEAESVDLMDRRRLLIPMPSLAMSKESPHSERRSACTTFSFTPP